MLTEIDVRRTLREKLGAEMEPYLILGACNPPLAHRALEQEQDIGLLLPYNVVVRAEGKGSRVEVADAHAMLGIVGNEELNTIAEEAKQHLLRVVASLGGLPQNERKEPKRNLYKRKGRSFFAIF